jgi:serine phosphatase RsbU (regulator of sigma subunit)
MNSYAMLERLKAERLEVARKSGDSRDVQAVDEQFARLLSEWDIKQAETDMSRDHAMRNANRQRLVDLVKASEEKILFAGIEKPGPSRAIFRASASSMPSMALGAEYQIGSVTVTQGTSGGRTVRQYVAPIKTAFGQEGGRAWVILDASSIQTAGAGLMTGMLIGVLISLFLVGAASFLLCLGASKGVNRVAKALESVARGDLSVRISPSGPAEVQTLGRAADRAVKAFSVIQERAYSQTDAAPIVVTAAPIDGVDTSALLPSEPPRVDGYEIESVHKPSMEGANDYFDYIRVDHGKLGFVIADMPHSGPKGAFIASTFRALMHAYGAGESSPAAVLSRVNRVMAGELKRGDHITAMYVVLDCDKGIASVASAGHLPLVFWKLAKKGSALLNPEGIAIGLDKGPVFEKTVVDKRIKLENGDRIVLYTDGPLAAKNLDEEEYGEQRFYYVVNREAPKNSAAFVNFVANEVDLFHEGAHQLDDITIVTVRRV